MPHWKKWDSLTVGQGVKKSPKKFRSSKTQAIEKSKRPFLIQYKFINLGAVGRPQFRCCIRFKSFVTLSWKVISIPHWPLPAVRDLTRNGRWSIYDAIVFKLSNPYGPMFYSGENAHAWETVLSYHYQQNSPCWVIFLHLAKPVLYVMSFLCW